MAERIRNLSRRESISIGSGDGMRARRFRAGLLKWCLGIFTAIVLGLAIILITPAGPTLASITSTSVTPSARIASTTNTPYRNGGVRFSWRVQRTPATNRTNGSNGKDGASTRVAGPCGDKSKRYIDCGNGTVTDTVTGLIWLKQSNCLPTADWEAAKKAAAGLKDGDCMLTDGSSPGDWRLPTQAEWEATMKNALALGCTGPTLTNDEGTACITAGPSSFTAVESDYYWSSTAVEGNARSWFGDLDHGHLLNGNLFNTLRVWPVRGGQR